jgi:hypothetical protein
MFDREKRQEKRQRRQEVKEQLAQQIKPRPTYAMRMEKKEKRAKRDEQRQKREGIASDRLTALHTGESSGEIVQLGSELLYLSALSALQFQIQEQMSSKDKCFTRWIVYGRHDKEFLGMAPTNREVQFGGVSVSSYAKNGDVTQEVHYWDLVSLLQQIQAP